MPRPAIPLLLYVSMAFDKLPGFMQIIYINVKIVASSHCHCESAMYVGVREAHSTHPPPSVRAPLACGFVPDEKIHQINEPRLLGLFFTRNSCVLS